MMIFSPVLRSARKSGILEIESKFESVYDIPLGNIQVDVIAVDGGEKTSVTLDENGKGQFKGTPGKFYRVHVQSEVTPEQVDELFSSYDGLTQQLEGWLRNEWQGFKPQWSQSAFGRGGQRNARGKLGRDSLACGTASACSRTFSRIPASSLNDWVAVPAQLAELAEKCSRHRWQKSKLLASDEAALCLLLRTASLWLEMLPPSEIAGKTRRSCFNDRRAACSSTF